jgi:hypothetical protein
MYGTAETQLQSFSSLNTISLLLVDLHRDISVLQGQQDATFVISLLRINSLEMFRALLAHLQEALHKQQLVFCVCVMSAGCYQC